MPLPDLDAALDARREAQLLRRRRTVDGPQGARVVIEGRKLLAFASNDYLGLANDARLKAAAITAIERYGVGAGASHLVSGHMTPHQALEDALAEFAGMARALLFSTGYMANLGVLTALAGRHDEIFADRLNHASLNDAARLSGARLTRYAHGDLAMLERQLAASPAKTKLVATDAVFSMDGDIADVPQLLALCRQYDAWLVLDDAHGFGVLGANGRGVLEYYGLAPDARLIYMATLGKAAGVSGAFVAGDATVIDWLLQSARTAIYTTAMPPALSAATGAALQIIAAEPWRRDHLAALIRHLRQRLADGPYALADSTTPIQPVLVGPAAATLALSQRLEVAGIWVPAIRPPTVPANTARLRISLSAAHTLADVDRLADALLAG